MILGTMTFGPQVDQSNASKIIDDFRAGGHQELDAAYVYNNGDTEKMLGQIGINEVKVATKANPRISGKLDAKAVRDQLTESLERMNRDKADLFYFHFPDPSTLVEEPLEEINRLFEEGKIGAFGLSNYAAWEVAKIHGICEREGWIKPTVYQGMYNGISRNVEPELFPALRDLEMSFYAYNPLAGGMLSGKYQDFNDDKEGRFSLRPNYKNRYWKKSIFDGIKVLEEKCAEEGITMIESAFRWLAYHSQMEATKGDGIILGVSKRAHLTSNLQSLCGDLPASIVEAYNRLWVETKSDSASYFRVPDRKK